MRRKIIANVEITFETEDEGTPDELAEKYVDDAATTVFDMFSPEWFDPAQGWTLEQIEFVEAREDAS